MLITGASRGIGAATALLAAQAGYDLVLNYAQDAAAAQALAAKLAPLGAASIVCQANVASESAVMTMFADLDRHFGRLDVLVNNAGIVGQKSALKDMSFGRWQNMFGINVLGSFLCAREAVKRMGAGASIVNVSSARSISGFRPCI